MGHLYSRGFELPALPDPSPEVVLSVAFAPVVIPALRMARNQAGLPVVVEDFGGAIRVHGIFANEKIARNFIRQFGGNDGGED
ncbi:MAG: hypothetical protein LBO05_04150 [Deltaproteobacteria bacterium]|jgi:hypothetical protein|nr:hypothetical protein [Deltaproteobacteria bacterium]